MIIPCRQWRQLIEEDQSHSGLATFGTPAVRYLYTPSSSGANNSRLVSITYPNSRVITYNYASGLDDSISRVTSISDNSGTLEQDSYLGLGTVVERTYPQAGVALSYLEQGTDPLADDDGGDQYTGLDRFGRVIDQNWINTVTGIALSRVQYGYDADGNKLYADNLTNGGSAYSELYTYDGFNQLQSFQRGTLSASLSAIQNASVNVNWSPDPLGNSQVSGTTTQNLTFNQQNQITSVNINSPNGANVAYDNNGNLISNGAYQYYYDAWNRLVAAKAQGSGPAYTQATYQYDALGRRTQESNVSGTTDVYFNAAGQAIEEQVGWQTTKQYVWSPAGSNLLVAMDNVANGQRFYFLQDPLGSVTTLADQQGNVVERDIYSAYGQVSVRNADWTPVSTNYGTNMTYLFQGGRFDVATGLYIFGARDLNPTFGRWMETDPARADLNTYRFASGNPTNVTDPSGMFSVWDDVLAPFIVSWDSALGNVQNGWFAETSNFSAGMGDTISMGLTSRVRQWVGYDDVVNRNSDWYTAGQVTGTVVNIGLAFANPCALSSTFGTAVRLINGVQAIGGTFNAGQNIYRGNYGAAALDILGVLGNVGQMLRACFAGETELLTAEGFKRIDQFQVGDKLLSRSEFDVQGPVEEKEVLRVFVSVAPIVNLHVAGKVVRTTAEHPFFVKDCGWIAAAMLNIGDLLSSHDGQWLPVEGVAVSGEITTVYNLEVADHRTYFVGGQEWEFSVWAHNVYEVGIARDLRKAPQPGTVVHHVPQSRQAESLVNSWNQANHAGNEAAIRILQSEHELINAAQAARTQVPTSAAELLAQDITHVTQFTAAPQTAIGKLIALAKSLHPWDHI